MLGVLTAFEPVTVRASRVCGPTLTAQRGINLSDLAKPPPQA